jgi:hypothetical protein
LSDLQMGSLRSIFSMTEVTSAMTIYEKGERDKEHAEMLALCFPREARFLIFCGQAPLDTQYSSSYTSTVKKRCLINLTYRMEGGSHG